MEYLARIGRLLYGIGVIALGAHQLITRDFRAEIVPPFPAWAHQFFFLPLLAGAAMIFAGIVISGLKLSFVSARTICFYLAIYFFVPIILCHLPYILIFNPDTALRLDVWFGAGEALAYSGGALVLASAYPADNDGRFETLMKKFIPIGRIFFAILMFVFGCSHFVFPDFVSTMVPKWIGAPMFWTYFVGVALLGASISIIFKIWIRPVSFLLAFMLFQFFLFFHVPDAIANPSVGHGNEIVRAIIALLFCGTAIMIGLTNGAKAHSLD